MPLRRADDILAWLLARQPDKRILEKTTGLPYGWGLWLRALSPLPPPLRAGEVIAELLQRPLPSFGGRLPALSHLQAMRRLLWQTWDPAPRDQRWMRWTSAALSVLLHVLFALFLLWVALIRPPVEPEQGGEGSRTQVEFVGRGTPQDEGGGEPAAAEAAAASSPAAAAAAAAATAAASASAPQPSAEPAPSEPQPAPPSPATPAVEQPLQATEVAQASTDFVVPPTSAPRTEVRVIPREQDLQVRERPVTVVEAPVAQASLPAPRAAEPQLRTPELAVREREIRVPDAPAPIVPVPGPRVEATVAPREVQVRERQVQPAPSAPVALATVPQREVAVTGPAPDVAVRERSVPNATARPAPPAPSTASSTATNPTSSASAATAPSSSAATTARSSQPAARPAADPGNWATQARSDDWGAANHPQDRDLNGRAVSDTGSSGGSLFNADGGVRVPGQDGKGASERGAPGGDKDGWTKERIAQSGTWLKRPPYNYTPTSLDKYWAPNESLLAEWVRKGIKSVEIPIPGSSSKISCVVSILQFGGGCGLTDPNMNDQPAVARPPPDIPFKKELQEDNGSR